MDVSCPKCQTVYEFDERQVRSGAVTLKCSQCRHLFRLESPNSVSEENQRRWMIRTKAGDILYFAGFDVLHRWIMERSVVPVDEISRTGKNWKALGEIGEFMPIFQVVESIASISAQSPPSKDSSEREPSGSRERPKTPSQTPSIETDPEPVRKRVSTAPQFPGSSRDSESFHSTGHRQPLETPGPRSRNETPAPSARGGGSAPRVLPPAPSSGENSKPRVHLEDSRFGPPSAQGSAGAGPSEVGPADSSSEADDWTIGELNVPGPELRPTRDTPRLSTAPPSSKRRLWLGLIVVGALAGAGVLGWSQADEIKAWWSAAQEPTVVTLGAESDSASSSKSDESAEEAARAIAEKTAKIAAADNAQRVEAAVTTSSKAITDALDPSRDAASKAYRPDFATLIARGQSALESGDAERARRNFHQAIELNRSSPEAITGLGWALLALGSTDAAAAQFQRALHRDGSYGDAYIGLGRAERSRGNLADALKAYETYLQRQPNGPQASIARFQSEQLRQSVGSP
ncbi:MAG: tetratricopeptide repeat protein [Bradymonadaceae bacterium]